MTMPVEPKDVVAAAELISEVLAPSIQRDWSVPAGRLDWSIRQTLAHAASASTKYGLCLASQTRRFVALRSVEYPDATNEDLLFATTVTARALAQVAESAPPGARGFHVAGMADAEGFVAMACVETLVHGWDVASGLGLDLHPAEDLARRVVSRLFPWAPPATPGWETLLWATGRIPLDDQEPTDSSWMWHCAPIEEWAGERAGWCPVTEWTLDKSGRWTGLVQE